MELYNPKDDWTSDMELYNPKDDWTSDMELYNLRQSGLLTWNRLI
jgi:hypothetical protein